MVYSFAKGLSAFSRNELIGTIEVSFLNEAGIDQGGPRAELFTKTVKELFAPETGLFKLTPNLNNLEINPLSCIVPTHLRLFQFAGILLAKVSL
jgi:E3 ubiquitin-protein ligase HUWE1